MSACRLDPASFRVKASNPIRECASLLLLLLLPGLLPALTRLMTAPSAVRKTPYPNPREPTSRATYFTLGSLCPTLGSNIKGNPLRAEATLDVTCAEVGPAAADLSLGRV